MDVVTLGQAALAAAKMASAGGNTYVGTGDSITETSSSRANNIWGDSWATYACLASGGRLIHHYTCAKGGYNTSQINGIIQTEVWGANLPHKLMIMADGTNDTDAIGQTLPNNETTIKGELKRGATVALCTIPPAGMQALGAPGTVTLTALPGQAGGTLPAGTYYYQITCRGTYGSSVPSAEQSVTLSATGAIQIDWTPVGGATGYAIWGRTTGNAKPLVWQNGSGTGQTTPQNRYIDLGAATTAGTMPTTDTSANNTLTTTTRAKITAVNNVKHYLANKYGLPVIDQYALLSDWSQSGQYKKNYTADGTHPIPVVQRQMGVNVANTLKPWLPPRTPYLAIDERDPTVFVPGPGSDTSKTGSLLTPNTGGDTRPAGWSWYGSGGGSSTLATDANVPGYVYTVNRTDWTSRFTDVGLGTTGWAVGDTLSVAFKIKTSGLDAIEGGSLAVGVKTQGSTGATYICNLNITRDVPTTDLPGGWAIFTHRAVVPPGTTGLLGIFYLVGPGTSASLAQFTVRNLTRLGLV